MLSFSDMSISTLVNLVPDRWGGEARNTCFARFLSLIPYEPHAVEVCALSAVIGVHGVFLFWVDMSRRRWSIVVL